MTPKAVLFCVLVLSPAIVCFGYAVLVETNDKGTFSGLGFALALGGAFCISEIARIQKRREIRRSNRRHHAH